MTSKGGRSGKTAQPSPTTAPLKGALRLEGENNDQTVLLQMVLAQMQAAEQERRLEMAALQQTLKSTQEEFQQARVEWQNELAAVKRDNAQYIDAVREQFQKLIEAKPVDRKTWQEMYRVAMDDANKKMAQTHAEFVAYLKSAPTARVNNDEAKHVEFIINGVHFIFKPGINNKVPKPFVDEWKKRKTLKQWAANFDLALQSTAQGTDQSANQIAVVTGQPLVWREDTGRL